MPLCAECASKENKIGNLAWMPFFIVGMLTCVIAFVPVWLLSPEGTKTQILALPYVLGSAAGWFAGVTDGSLVEFGLRMLFAPKYGKLLLKRMLTVFSAFSDSEELIGLSTRFADNRKTLRMIFENDNTGREFIALNPQEK